MKHAKGKKKIPIKAWTIKIINKGKRKNTREAAAMTSKLGK